MRPRVDYVTQDALGVLVPPPERLRVWRVRHGWHWSVIGETDSYKVARDVVRRHRDLDKDDYERARVV